MNMKPILNWILYIIKQRKKEDKQNRKWKIDFVNIKTKENHFKLTKLQKNTLKRNNLEK